MALQFFDNMCFQFLSTLSSTDDTLPISNADKNVLCEKLGEDGHTYLTITNRRGTEVLRIECMGSEPFIVNRGVDAITAAVGDCACFKINQQILEEYLGIQHCETVIETDTPDFITLVPPSDDPEDCTWKVNLSDDLIARLDKCCPVEDCNCETNCVIADGTYENATLTVVNGAICSVETGRNIVYTGGACCGCDSCDTEETTT